MPDLALKCTFSQTYNSPPQRPYSPSPRLLWEALAWCFICAWRSTAWCRLNGCRAHIDDWSSDTVIYSCQSSSSVSRSGICFLTASARITLLAWAHRYVDSAKPVGLSGACISLSVWYTPSYFDSSSLCPLSHYDSHSMVDAWRFMGRAVSWHLLPPAQPAQLSRAFSSLWLSYKLSNSPYRLLEIFKPYQDWESYLNSIVILFPSALGANYHEAVNCSPSDTALDYSKPFQHFIRTTRQGTSVYCTVPLEFHIRRQSAYTSCMFGLAQLKLSMAHSGKFRACSSGKCTRT